MTATMRIWLDANQGETKLGNAFGYIGAHDTDDDGNDYCGWFFDWPSAKARVTSQAEVDAVLQTLETDETAQHLPKIPRHLAEEKLSAMLERNLARNCEAASAMQ